MRPLFGRPFGATSAWPCAPCLSQPISLLCRNVRDPRDPRYDKYTARELFRMMGCSERLYKDAFEPMLLVGLFAPGEQCSAAGDRRQTNAPSLRTLLALDDEMPATYKSVADRNWPARSTFNSVYADSIQHYLLHCGGTTSSGPNIPTLINAQTINKISTQTMKLMKTGTRTGLTRVYSVYF